MQERFERCHPDMEVLLIPIHLSLAGRGTKIFDLSQTSRPLASRTEEVPLRTIPPGRVGALRDFGLTPTAYVDRVDLPTKVIACVVDDLLAVRRVVRIVAPLRDFDLASPAGADRVDPAVFLAGGREG